MASTIGQTFAFRRTTAAGTVLHLAGIFDDESSQLQAGREHIPRNVESLILEGTLSNSQKGHQK